MYLEKVRNVLAFAIPWNVALGYIDNISYTVSSVGLCDVWISLADICTVSSPPPARPLLLFLLVSTFPLDVLINSPL